MRQKIICFFFFSFVSLQTLAHHARPYKSDSALTPSVSLPIIRRSSHGSNGTINLSTSQSSSLSERRSSEHSSSSGDNKRQSLFHSKNNSLSKRSSPRDEPNIFPLNQILNSMLMEDKIDLMVKLGAEKKTHLMFAVLCDEDTLVARYLETVDPNIQDIDGNTALHCAGLLKRRDDSERKKSVTKQRREQILNTFLSNPRADIYKKNNNGATILDLLRSAPKKYEILYFKYLSRFILENFLEEYILERPAGTFPEERIIVDEILEKVRLKSADNYEILAKHIDADLVVALLRSRWPHALKTPPKKLKNDDQNRSDLMHAVFFDNIEKVKEIMGNNAFDPKAKDNDGNTVVHYAVMLTRKSSLGPLNMEILATRYEILDILFKNIHIDTLSKNKQGIYAHDLLAIYADKKLREKWFIRFMAEDRIRNFGIDYHIKDDLQKSILDMKNKLKSDHVKTFEYLDDIMIDNIIFSRWPAFAPQSSYLGD